jgi:Phage integrase, N-terminal SAM-like domain
MKTRLREKTFEDYTGLLEKHVRPLLGKKLLVGIRPLDIQDVYQKMIERRLSPATVHHPHWILNAGMRQGVEWEMLVNAPTKGLKLPRIVKREMQVSSVEQAKSFLKRCAADSLWGGIRRRCHHWHASQ